VRHEARATLRHGATLTRTWPIDAARGVAVVMMIVYHAAFDLATFGDLPLDPNTGFWGAFSYATAASFIFLAGLSLPLSQARAIAAGRTGGALWRHFLARGAWIFNWGFGITLATWALFPQAPILFGILHLIGVAIPLAYPFLRFTWANLVLGTGLVALGVALRGVAVDTPWLLWLGLRPVGFTSVDYRPLLPWFGVILLGVGVGNLLRAARARHHTPPVATPTPALAAPLALLGRHSLPIYLLHQPLLIVLLWGVGLIDPGFLG
jgi:uncharacterized membrane protein